MPLTTHGFHNERELIYHGGPTLTNARIFVIYWGDVPEAAKLSNFYCYISKSQLFTNLKEYGINHGNFIGDYTINDSTETKFIYDFQIRAKLLDLIESGQIIQPDDNTYFAIHFATSIQSIRGPSGLESCKYGGYCAYHSTFIQSNGKFIYYGVIPAQNNLCATHCGTSSDPFDNLTGVSSHELVETVTDPAIGVASTLGHPIAWYDPFAGEAVDICNGQTGKIGNYTVQKFWSNKRRLCI